MAACGNDTPAAPTPTSAITLSGNMNFGNVTVGTTRTSTLTIANTGAGELTVTSVAIRAVSPARSRAALFRRMGRKQSP